MRKLNKILSVTILSASISSVYAQSMNSGITQGNPLDSLPKVNINKNKAPTIKIEKEDSPVKSIQEQKVTIKEFKIQGVKSIDFKNVSALFMPLTNKEITVNELLETSKKVTKLYKDAGYILSFAYVPQQDFKNGIASIVIVEGYVKDIKIKGKLSNNEVRVTKLLQPLKDDRPLTQKTFERVTNVLALQPGVKININIAPPNTVEGGTTLDAEIVQKKVDFTVGVEAGNPRFQSILAGTINSLTPLGDQLTLSTLVPAGENDTKYYGLNYAVPLNSDGLIGKVNITSYKESPEQASLNTFGYNEKYENKSQRLSVGINYPVILENQRNWFIGGGIYFNKEMQTYSPINNAVFPDLSIMTRLSVLYLETSYAKVDKNQSRQLGLSLYKGINGLGAKKENNLNDIDFIKIKMQANQNFTLPKNFEARFAGVYQYSPDTLPSSEQISFGGRNFGAAYEPGEIAGDKGWGLSSELNYSYKPNYKYVKLIQPYVALDTSRISFNKSKPDYAHLSSATLGARLNNQTYYSLNLSVSKPLARTPNDGDELRYYMSYSYQF